MTFTREEEKIPCFFEEYFDEADNIVKLLLRSSKNAGMPYSIIIQGKHSLVEFSGNIQGFNDSSIETSSQCLQIFSLQMRKYAFIEENELRYKVIINII